MRIIAGDFRGRQIQTIKGDATRPTSDKVKESIFNMIGQFFDGGFVLDLFAGSGNLGIEALSRGADTAVFVDASMNAIKMIKGNIGNLKLENRAQIYRNDAFKALNVLGKKGNKFDLIFLDPPYGKIAITALLEQIVVHDLLNEGGLVVCECAEGMEIGYEGSQLRKIRHEIYGNIQILILEKGGINR